MVDVVDPATRSRMMSGIRSKNTKPELLVRSYLHGRGLRFRLHVKTLPGKPDIVLPKYRAVVFVHGCFWHRHPGCKFAYLPNSRPDFWVEKLSLNAARDKVKANALIKSGWRVFTVWECELRKGTARLDALYNEITQGSIDDTTHAVE
ncbi:MAG: DNA mismatch endonuclease Vsr [Thiobacillus sp.]|jgi:DNA mismatch endonuclease (patch repair protein)